MVQMTQGWGRASAEQVCGEPWLLQHQAGDTMDAVQCRALPQHLLLCVCPQNEVMSTWMWPGYLENLGQKWPLQVPCAF